MFSALINCHAVPWGEKQNTIFFTLFPISFIYKISGHPYPHPQVPNFTENQFRNAEDVFLFLFLYGESDMSTIPATVGEKGLQICIID